MSSRSLDWWLHDYDSWKMEESSMGIGIVLDLQLCTCEVAVSAEGHQSFPLSRWSLGVVLFTAIVGYPPFSEGYEDGMELNEQIKNGERDVSVEVRHSAMM